MRLIGSIASCLRDLLGDRPLDLQGCLASSFGRDLLSLQSLDPGLGPLREQRWLALWIRQGYCNRLLLGLLPVFAISLAINPWIASPWSANKGCLLYVPLLFLCGARRGSMDVGEGAGVGFWLLLLLLLWLVRLRHRFSCCVRLSGAEPRGILSIASSWRFCVMDGPFWVTE